MESIAKEVILLNSGTVLQVTPPGALLERMRGKVWTALCDSAQLEPMMQRFCISNAAVHGEQYLVRIVSDTKPTDSAEPAQPNLEDAYLYYFGEAS